MGIEIWALIALVAVLAVYLLPILVGRREVLGHSRVEDRYSSQLRLLAVGPQSQAGGETCPEGGHAEIFRRRPEVRRESAGEPRPHTGPLLPVPWWGCCSVWESSRR